MNDSDEVVREETINEIAEAARRSVALLRDACSSSDGRVRDRAIQAIGEVEHEAMPAIDIILHASLEDPDCDAVGAMMSISSFGASGVPALTAALQNIDLADSAAMELGEMGKSAQSAVPALEKVLLKENLHMLSGKAVAWAMARTGPLGSATLAKHATSSDPKVRFLVAYGLTNSVKAGEKEIRAISHLLMDDVPWVRVEAAEAAGSFGEDAAPFVPRLVDALKDKYRPMRLAAAMALGDIGKPALQELERLYQSGDDEAKILATIALGRMAAAVPEAIPVLQEATKSPLDSVRIEAEKALRLVEGEHNGLEKDDTDSGEKSGVQQE